MKKIIIVTVNYNTDSETKKLLTSLEKVKTTDIDLQIIVVDNGSDKKLVIEENKTVSLLRTDDNLGFTGGYNIGMKKALDNSADYIVIMNNDTIADPDFIFAMKKVLEEDTKIGVTIPKIYFTKGHEFHKDRYQESERGKVFWYAGGFMDWDNVVSIHRGVDEVDHGQYDKIEPVGFATGCCMMFKREVLEQVGLFDEKYFLYYEDADMNQRMERAGFGICYVPNAVLSHSNAVSSGGAGKGNTLQDYFMTRNQMLFGMMYAPLRSKIALVRQSFRLLRTGREYQKKGIKDYYLGRFGKGTYFNK